LNHAWFKYGSNSAQNIRNHPQQYGNSFSFYLLIARLLYWIVPAMHTFVLAFYFPMHFL